MNHTHMLRTFLTIALLLAVTVAPLADAKGKDRNKPEDSPIHTSQNHSDDDDDSRSSKSSDDAFRVRICDSLTALREEALARVPRCDAALATSSEVAAAERSSYTVKLKELERRAKTKEAKAAVAEYKKTVDAALSRHERVVATEYATYNDRVRKVLDEQRKAFAVSCKDLSTETARAFDEARARCSAGASDDSVRSALRARLSGAESAFVSRKSSVQDDVIKRLRKERDTKVQASAATYMASTTAALEGLRAGLKR